MAEDLDKMKERFGIEKEGIDETKRAYQELEQRIKAVNREILNIDTEEAKKLREIFSESRSELALFARRLRSFTRDVKELGKEEAVSDIIMEFESLQRVTSRLLQVEKLELIAPGTIESIRSTVISMDNLLEETREYGTLSADIKRDLIRGYRDIGRSIREVSRETRTLEQVERKRGEGIAPADVMRGIGRLPGLEMVGQLGGLLAGGVSIMAVADAVGTLVKTIDQFIMFERESRRAMAVPGVVPEPRLADDVRRGLELYWDRKGIPATAKDINNLLAVMARQGNELIFQGKDQTISWTDMLDLLNQANEAQEQIREQMEMMSGRSMVGGGGTGLVLDIAGRLGILPMPGREELMEKSENLAKIYSDTIDIVGEFTSRMHVLSMNLGMTDSQLLDTLRSFQRLSGQTELMSDSLMDYLATVVVSAKDQGVVTGDYVEWVKRAYTVTRFFSLDLEQTNKIVGAWAKELNNNILTVEEFGTAFQRAMGIMSPEDLMTEFMMIGEVIEKSGNIGLNQFYENLQKLGPAATMITSLITRQGEVGLEAVRTRYGKEGEEMYKFLVDLAGSREQLKEYSEGIRASRTKMLEPVAALGGEDPFARFYMMYGTGLMNLPTMFTTPLNQLVDKTALTLEVGQRELTITDEMKRDIAEYKKDIRDYKEAFMAVEELMKGFRIVYDEVSNWMSGDPRYSPVMSLDKKSIDDLAKKISEGKEMLKEKTTAGFKD